MIKALKRINDALPQRGRTRIAEGASRQISRMWFVKDKIRYTSGLWIGIALAIYMAVHIGIVIRTAVDTGVTDGHTRRISAKSVVRYIVVCAVVFAETILKIGNPILTFVGILGLKLSAYAQPFITKQIEKRKG